MFYTVSFKFSSIFVISFSNRFNGHFMSIKIKIRRNFKSVLTSMVEAIHGCKDIQSAAGQR